MKLDTRLKLELMVKAHVKVNFQGHKVKATVQFEANFLNKLFSLRAIVDSMVRFR